MEKELSSKIRKVKKLYEYEGYKYNINQLAEISGISCANIQSRLRGGGWDIDRVVNTKFGGAKARCEYNEKKIKK